MNTSDAYGTHVPVQPFQWVAGKKIVYLGGKSSKLPLKLQQILCYSFQSLKPPEANPPAFPKGIDNDTIAAWK